MDSRKKGLAWCREVRKILESVGHKVEGPGYGIVFIKGHLMPVHKDYFGCLDLVSYSLGEYYGHQITSPSNKSDRAKKVGQAGLKAWIWVRDKPANRIRWRVYRPGFDKPTIINEEGNNVLS